VLISPSCREEGLPLSIVEALFAGCAVIATGSGGACEVAAAAGLPLFPQNSPGELSKLIARLLENPGLAFQIGRRGQETAFREFTFARMAESFCNTLYALHEDPTRNRNARFESGMRTTDVDGCRENEL